MLLKEEFYSVYVIWICIVCCDGTEIMEFYVHDTESVECKLWIIIVLYLFFFYTKHNLMFKAMKHDL